MNTHESSSEDDSDFGHTVPGFRSGEGSRSILPYLKNSLKVNPNLGPVGTAGNPAPDAPKRITTSRAPAGGAAPARPDAILMPRPRKPPAN